VGETHREMRMMYHLMRNLPVLGTLGVAALLAGPLARLPIDVGAWLLERGAWLLERRLRGRGCRRSHAGRVAVRSTDMHMRSFDGAARASHRRGAGPAPSLPKSVAKC
jgi:hypothetical protein